MKRLTIFLLAFFIVTSSASALKISSRETINFEPGLVFENEVCIWPSDIKHIKLTPQGTLADNIEISQTDLDMSEGPGCVPYNVTLPEEFDRPGIHKSAIRASEIAPGDRGGQIVALVHVDHQIWVDVPYPGKYLETRFSAENTESGNPVKLTASITNKGDETIREVTGFATIYDQEGEQAGRVLFDPVAGLESQEKATITTYWDSSGYEVGDYRAELYLDYDGEEAEDEAAFKLGSVEVRLTGHTEEIYKRGIVPFNVQVESYWSQTIENVKAQVEVMNGSEVVEAFETLSQDLQPWETKSLKGYLDTEELSYANYSLNITLLFEGESRNYLENLEVVKEPEPEEENPSTISMLGSYFNNTKALLMTTIILALITLFLIIKVFFLDTKKESPSRENIP